VSRGIIPADQVLKIEGPSGKGGHVLFEILKTEWLVLAI